MSISSDPLQREMEALFAAFLLPGTASRFTVLLGFQPSRWRKIDPWRVWQDALPGTAVEWDESVERLLMTPEFARYAEAEVTVLRCGHDQPGLGRQALKTALTGPAQVFEAFISVLPGTLGLAVNHDGLLCVLRR